MTFREDLYYRLRVFPIHVPALRNRAQDIPRLVRHFTEIYSQRMNKRIDVIPPETMDALGRYQWPGNVRELQNFIERAVILSPHSVLSAPHLRAGAIPTQQRTQCPDERSCRGGAGSYPSCAGGEQLGHQWRGYAFRNEANIVGLQNEEASDSSA